MSLYVYLYVYRCSRFLKSCKISHIDSLKPRNEWIIYCDTQLKNKLYFLPPYNGCNNSFWWVFFFINSYFKTEANILFLEYFWSYSKMFIVIKTLHKVHILIHYFWYIWKNESSMTEGKKLLSNSILYKICKNSYRIYTHI